MGHPVALGPDLGGVHAPFGRGGLLEHDARGRTRAPHRHEEVPQAARAVGVLVAVDLLEPRRLGDAHLLPFGAELVGHDHGDRGPHPLAHFGAVDGHGDAAVLGDRDEDVGVVAPAVGHRVAAELLHLVLRATRTGQAHREDERRGPRAAQEAAAADVDDGHPAHHFASAACLMAARIRGYVPQRHRFALITASMSSSVTAWPSSTRAAARMSCPAWQ